FAGLVAMAIVLRVFRRKECALMVIEPPGNFGRWRVFKINDGILVAIKILFVEQRPCAVYKSAELKVGILANAIPVEAGKQCGRSSPVKALIVKKYPDFHSALPFPASSG